MFKISRNDCRNILIVLVVLVIPCVSIILLEKLITRLNLNKYQCFSFTNYTSFQLRNEFHLTGVHRNVNYIGLRAK